MGKATCLVPHPSEYILICKDGDYFRFNPLMGDIPNGFTKPAEFKKGISKFPAYSENGRLDPRLWALQRYPNKTWKDGI
jgi:hypothetical protein